MEMTTPAFSAPCALLPWQPAQFVSYALLPADNDAGVAATGFFSAVTVPVLSWLDAAPPIEMTTASTGRADFLITCLVCTRTTPPSTGERGCGTDIGQSSPGRHVSPDGRETDEGYDHHRRDQTEERVRAAVVDGPAPDEPGQDGADSAKPGSSADAGGPDWCRVDMRGEGEHRGLHAVDHAAGQRQHGHDRDHRGG